MKNSGNARAKKEAEQEQQYRSWVEVDLGNLTHNWREIRRLVGPHVRILQVVKADAYGHGAIEVSNVALQSGATHLGVANADEGVQLRVGGIEVPIIILSPSIDSEIPGIIKYNLTPSVSDIGFARELSRRLKKAGVKLPVHIEADTGMGRGGTLYSEAFDMIREVHSLPNITIEGIFTHLSSSEIENDEYNLRQWELFKELLDKLEKSGISIPIRHMANSGGVLNFQTFHLEMVRPGIMSYGIYPSPELESKAKLLPVMSFKTRVMLLKDFPEGHGIGYNRTYVTKGPTRIATIPVGYGDGYGRILSNQSDVLIRGTRAPVVGRVSMDMCTIDVTHIPACEIGDEVVLLGRQGKEYISANEIAAKAQTISYEILCALGKRAPRVFVHKGKVDTVEPRLRRIFIPDEEKSLSRIDNVIRRCFQARAEDTEMGDAIFYEMFETLFGKEDRRLELRTNFRYEISVADFPKKEVQDDPQTINYFKVTTHIEYTKTLRNNPFIIGCALNNQQLSELFEDPRCEYRWLLFGRDALFKESDFQVDRVCVDQEVVPIIRSGYTTRGYEIWCGGDVLKKKINRPVRLKIDIQTKKYKSSNNFSVYLVYPTRGLDISFHYAGTKLKNVREVSFFAGKHPYPQVVTERGKSIRLAIADDDWVFPNSGVTFIWDL
ncbi:MAG TPA: alanine racemase [Syntrophales bacterium]|nr:alanine racemase [Syntrophales bacterium]HPN25066.1 alanine racemase [Syntrophales bacterium]HQM29191.1 alanine racemase [Syntrophales bacterium]